MTMSVNYNGRELHGWRRWLVVIPAVIGALLVVLLGVVPLLLATFLVGFFVTLAGFVVRAVTGKWPEWLQIEVG
jgi:drug/metabolite transporter (DMT)-like permease